MMTIIREGKRRERENSPKAEYSAHKSLSQSAADNAKPPLRFCRHAPCNHDLISGWPGCVIWSFPRCVNIDSCNPSYWAKKGMVKSHCIASAGYFDEVTQPRAHLLYHPYGLKKFSFLLHAARPRKTINHGLNSSRVPRRLLNHSLDRPFLLPFERSWGHTLIWPPHWMAEVVPKIWKNEIYVWEKQGMIESKNLQFCGRHIRIDPCTWALQRGIIIGSRRFAYGFAGSPDLGGSSINWWPVSRET